MGSQVSLVAAVASGASADGSAGSENGSVEVKMRPPWPTRTQSEVEAQEAEKSPFSGDSVPSSPGGVLNGTRFSKRQEAAPPLGSVEVRTLPLSSTATQRLSVGQETPVILIEVPALASCQPAAAPLGSVEVRTFPVLLPAAQSRVDTQETPCRPTGPPGVPASAQVEAPPVGSVETKMRPSPPVATQSEGVPQETPRSSGSRRFDSPASCPRSGRSR